MLAKIGNLLSSILIVSLIWGLPILLTSGRPSIIPNSWAIALLVMMVFCVYKAASDTTENG